ncbi:TetR/AcrR family transcriptional regulator [Tumidithrix elongata RA019]|uniref:TetR/AcrR family transcriptional regulator n=1 Tax=Tumidithrix elongata BACA0141 TaxID=2716417 RepID=A0AAW9PW46_9CYAN|nr:TetR/AcrR family transcriptional regulator [Tumidithrix elongata RA019]
MTLAVSHSLTSDRKKEKILQGAMQVFFRDGYAGTSMDRVAIEAGVSKQTIYSHFHDKESLFKALIEQLTIARFQALFESDQLSGEPDQLLRQLAETYLLKVAEDREYLSLLKVIIAESSRFPEMAKLYYQTVIQRGRQLLSQYFDAHPELGIKDAEAASHIFFGSLVSFVVVQEIIHGKEIMPLSSQNLVDCLIDLMVRGSTFKS